MEREKFSSRLGFILISAGCAIGLGNVYRFPIITGAFGGALFVFIYIAFLLLLGVPAMTLELTVGRASRRSIASSFDVLEKPGQKWHLMKYAGIAGNYLLMMFYTCISGWMVIYMFKFLTGSVSGITDPAALGDVFGGLVGGQPGLQVIVTYAVIILCFLVCSLGLQKGVERVTKWMMVALFALILFLAVYSCTLSGAGEGLKFYFVPNFEHFVSAGPMKVISAAMGQAFFTLSVGIGSIAIFGSYIGKERSLLGEALTIAGLDTAIALLAGLIIFPACFTFGTAPSAEQAGAGFLFTNLTAIFNNMAGGCAIGTVFFLFMTFAALSTVIAVFENIMSFWLELTHLRRPLIALINIGLFMVLTLPAILGNNVWSSVTVFGKAFLDLEDFIVSNLLLPIGSLVYCFFCTTRYGWGWKNYSEELNAGVGVKLGGKWFRVYMSVILPIIILAVLVMSLI